jgi:hypothetical protein
VKFQATVELGGRTATGIAVPDEVVTALSTSKRPPVRVTIGGHTYRTTVARMGGRFLVPVSAEVRAASGVAAGDVVDVDIEPDDAPREVAVPDDLAAALDAVPGARARFDALAHSRRKEHVRAVEEAKAPATRERRIARAVEQLSR